MNLKQNIGGFGIVWYNDCNIIHKKEISERANSIRKNKNGPNSNSHGIFMFCF